MFNIHSLEIDETFKIFVGYNSRWIKFGTKSDFVDLKILSYDGGKHFHWLFMREIRTSY
jgi:hypothetical protein